MGCSSPTSWHARDRVRQGFGRHAHSGRVADRCSGHACRADVWRGAAVGGERVQRRRGAPRALAVFGGAARKARRVRADPSARRPRRRTLSFLALVAVRHGFGMVWWALTFRHQLGPRKLPNGTFPGCCCFRRRRLFGVSLGLLLRSPFRMPIGERLFRIVWLGPIGRRSSGCRPRRRQTVLRERRLARRGDAVGATTPLPPRNRRRHARPTASTHWKCASPSWNAGGETTDGGRGG